MHSIIFHFCLKGVDTSYSHTVNHADAVFVHRVKVHLAVADGLYG